MVRKRFESSAQKFGTFEHELSMHLERAHELARRAKASNCALQEQLRRAQEITDQLTGRIWDPFRHE